MPGATSPHKVVISAVVTRADGTVEDMGVVDLHHPDPRLLARFRKLLDAGVHIREEHVLGDAPPKMPRRARSRRAQEKG